MVKMGGVGLLTNITQQLRTWLTGHSAKEKRQSTKVDLSLFTQKEKGRAPQAIEIYQTLYADKVKTHVNQALSDASAKSRSEQMSIRRATMIGLFESKDDEVLEVVKSALEERKKELKAEEDVLVDGTVDGERTPAEYHK